MPDVSKSAPSPELALYLADTTLAAGLRYGLWVERAPSTEEQVAVSSMSQDKLGQARQFYQIAEGIVDQDVVELQYDRDPEAFAWNPAWLTDWPTWSHFVLGQVLLGGALLEDLESLAEDNPLREPLAKIEQEESWHARHGAGWLAQAGGDEASREPFQQALDDLWPHVVAYFGPEGEERFPEDLDTGALAISSDEARQRFLDATVPQLEDAGIKVRAEQADGVWTTDPTPSEKLVERSQTASEEIQLELAAMLQVPDNREMAEL